MKKKSRRVLAFIITIFLIFLIDSNYRIDTSEYELFSERLPSAFDGFRIVQLSDLHAAQFGKKNERLISAIQDALPDIIVITGDLIDDAGQLDFAENLLSNISLIAPVYYISGNHDWASGDGGELISLLQRCGIHYLDETSELICRAEEYIRLIGIRDPAYLGMTTPLNELVGKYGTQEYTVVLTHRNSSLSDAAAAGVDTLLCGHAHGGVIRLPFTDGLIGPHREFFPTYTSGLYRQGSTDMIVSRGLWLNIKTPRFLNNPHLPVIVLKCA